MSPKRLLCALIILLSLSSAAAQEGIDAVVDRELPSLVETYKALHAAPELSYAEEKTAAFVAKELRGLGFDVTERVGKYGQPGLTSYGVVAVLKNGDGPVVWVRSDLDALPVEEKTGLPYASRVRAAGEGGEVGVMHACGHDVHIAAAAGVPDDKMPTVVVSEDEHAPATFNDPVLTRRLAAAFEKQLGAANVVKMQPVMGSEDFGEFGLEGHQIPVAFFWLGAVDPAKAAESERTKKPLPSLHSSLFAPLPEPTIRTGVRAMTAAVLDLMKQQ